MDYISALATNIVLAPEIKKLKHSLSRASSGFVKIRAKAELPGVPPPPVDADRDLPIFHFPCCDETVKAGRREKFFCIICGREIDIAMSDSNKVFLSHKGVDKGWVTDFKETLALLGYSPWIDDDAMPAGIALERGLLKGMEDSCGVVFFITPFFRDEGYLETEINYAISEKRRKGDKFAIITLQFVDADGKVGEIPALLKTYVWKKPPNDLHAIREIIRALPIQPGPVDWRDGIEGVVKMPVVKSKSVELSPEATTILLEATAGDGSVIHLRHLGGEGIRANGKSLIPDSSQRTTALWVGGLEDLTRRRLIKDRGYKQEVFEVTREGYQAADELRKSS